MRGRLAAILLALPLLAPAAASAAAPVCSPATGLEANVQEGEFINLPQAPCTDSDGDPISIEITQAPTLGTLTPTGTQPIATQRKYTADADAGGQTDVIKFDAVTTNNNQHSNVAELQINISENHAPVCPANVDLSVESGKPLVISRHPCTDADGDPLSVTIVGGPDHGTFNATNPAGPYTYTSQAGYVGPDRVTYRASDASTQSNVGAVSITVTAPPGGGGTPPPPVVTPPPPDVTPPALSLRPPSSALRRALRRGLSVTLTTGEPGRATIRLLLSKRDARRLGINRKAKRPVAVGRLTRTLSAGDTKVAVKLTRKARRRLARVRTVKLTLVVTITDAAGNVRSVTRAITLRRPG